MNDLAKILIITGVILSLAGVCLLSFGKIPGLGRLPGDILIKKENTTLYFPITTCIVLSLIISFFFFLWNQK